MKETAGDPASLYSASHVEVAFTEQLIRSRLGMGEKTAEEVPAVTGFFSPVIDGTLAELLLMSTPGEAKHDKLSKAELAQRFMSLDILEGWHIDMGNPNTAYMLQSSIKQGAPFGLYLRNFILGSRTEPGGIDPFGTPQSMTMMSPEDVKMQRSLEKTFPGLPFVAVSNPAFSVGVLPQVILSNEEWLSTVESLIEYAALIVVFFLTSTPGVLQEFEVLRKLGAKNRTIIVVATDDPRSNTLLDIPRVVYRQPKEKKPVWDENTASLLPADFPHCVTLTDNAESWQKVANGIVEIMKNFRSQPPPSAPLVIPERPKPARQITDQLTKLALGEFDKGRQLSKEGRGEEAEDTFIRSLVYSYFAWDPLGRAVTFIELGNVERLILKYPNEAVACYFNALNLFETLLIISPTARDYFEQLARGLDLYLKELGAVDRANAVMERFNELKASGIFDKNKSGG